MRIQSKFSVCFLLLGLILSACQAPQQPQTVVGPNQIGYRLNPEYLPGADMDPVSQTFVTGDTIDPKFDLIDAILVVGQGKVALYGSRVLGPGTYPRIPNGLAPQVDAAVVATEVVALYKRDGHVEVLGPGAHNIEITKVVFWPAGKVRYRTLADTLLGDPNACSSYLCEATISATLADGVKVYVDVDVIFGFLFTPQVNADMAYNELQSPTLTVQNLIGTPLRSKLRGALIERSISDMNSAEGRIELEREMKSQLDTAVADIPMVIHSVNIRGVTVGDEEFQQKQAELAAQLEEERNRQQLLLLQRDNLGLEISIEATREANSRTEQLANAETLSAALGLIFEVPGNQDWQSLKVVLDALYGQQGEPLPFMVTPNASAP